jgi:hypothetical protein
MVRSLLDQARRPAWECHITLIFAAFQWHLYRGKPHVHQVGYSSNIVTCR